MHAIPKGHWQTEMDRDGPVRVIATDFDKPNGIAFSADGKTAYM